MTSGPFPSRFLVDAPDLNPMLLGWIDLLRTDFFGATIAYVSADSPTFVVSSDVDLTGILQPGHRFKITQDVTATPTTYYIVTKVGSYSGGTMNITLLAPNDGTVLENATITACSFSPAKAPYGFPIDPAKWFWETKDTSSRSTSSPSASTWYNPGGGALSFDVPIGAWIIEGDAFLELVYSAGVGSYARVTLSTANNSESDSELSQAGVFVTSSGKSGNLTYDRQKPVSLSSKATYYLNALSEFAVTSFAFRGDKSPTLIRARCAYL